MTWASDAYKRGPHYVNQVGVRASCGQCHIPYDSSRATPVEYVQLPWFKADRGAKDFRNESHKTIATQEEWKKRRPLLRTTFENYLISHNYITCRGCHALDSFAGPRSQMNVLAHKDVIKDAAVDCLQCHRNVWHSTSKESRKRADGTARSRRRPELRPIEPPLIGLWHPTTS